MGRCAAESGGPPRREANTPEARGEVTERLWHSALYVIYALAGSSPASSSIVDARSLSRPQGFGFLAGADIVSCELTLLAPGSVHRRLPRWAVSDYFTTLRATSISARWRKKS
jgi:hypothetical protein